MTVLAVADADSYLKWSVAVLDRLPPAWITRQTLLDTPVAPSAEQARAASSRPLTRLSLSGLRGLLQRERPDVLLLACTGPTVQLLTGLAELRGRHRPLLVTGLPGISIPASTRAIDLRRGCDLFVVHSRRERAEFTRLAAERAPGLLVALSRLPFLTGARSQAERLGRGPAVVFAAQAKVPARREDREAILLALADVEPAGAALVKVRARAGEQQTHREELPYADLWAALVADGRVHDGAVSFAAGSMADALADARCLVTVSSTAALEAIDADVPVVVLTDFGVDAAMINLVFVGSGCLGDLADVRAGRAFRPDPDWLADNYFHPCADDDLLDLIESLLASRRAAGLPRRRSGHRFGPRRLRALARVLLPRRVVNVLRRVQRRR